MNKRTIQWHLNQADKLASGKIEKLARTILKNHPELKEFIIANGSAFFTTHDEKDDIIYLDRYVYMKPLFAFIDKWDDDLKVTGIPMRFTANGKKRTDW